MNWKGQRIARILKNIAPQLLHQRDKVIKKSDAKEIAKKIPLQGENKKTRDEIDAKFAVMLYGRMKFEGHGKCDLCSQRTFLPQTYNANDYP